MPKNKSLSGGLFARKPQPLTIKETDLSASIAQWLDAHHIYNDRLNSGKIFTGNRVITLCKPGTPDRYAIIKGNIIFIEVKQFGKKATLDQLTRHAELERSGATVIVADSFDSFLNQFKPLMQ